MTGRNGFSLLELVLVTAIFAVLAAMAAPRYANALANYRTEVAARRIVADLTLARSEARTAGASRTVAFDVSASTVVVTGLADLDNPAAKYTVDLRREPYEAQLISADFGGDTVVVFDGYGKPDSGGTVVVQSGGRRRTVALDGDAGKAAIR